MLGNGQFPAHRVGVLGQIVGSDDEEAAAVGRKVLCRHAGGGYAEHDAEGDIRLELHAPLGELAAAVVYHLHGGIPVLDVCHHGEHDPQRAFCGGTHEGADLNCHLGQIAQAAADAPQAQLGGLDALIGVGHGAVSTEVEGAHRHHPAPGGGEAGGVEQILLLLVHGMARHHHVAAAQQAHAGRAGLHRGPHVLGAEAVGQKLEFFAVPGAVGQLKLGVQLLVLALHLADAGDGSLPGGGIRVKDALTLGGVQDDLAAVAVFQKIFAHLGDTRDVQRAGDDGRMALAAALGGDEAEDAARRDAEQIGGHEQVRRKDDRVVEGQPAAEPVAEDVGDALGHVEDVHAPQLHVGVVLHGGQLGGVAAAHTVHRLGGTDAGFYLESHLIHEALVFQHHALEQEDGLLRGRGAASHLVQLLLSDLDGVFQRLLFLFGVERPLAEHQRRAVQPADLTQHEAGRCGKALIYLHVSISSGGTLPVSARQTSACKKVLGSRAARAACAGPASPSNSGSKLLRRSKSHFARKASPKVRVV